MPGIIKESSPSPAVMVAQWEQMNTPAPARLFSSGMVHGFWKGGERGGDVRDHNGCFVRAVFLFVLPDETKPLSTISVWTKSSEIKCKNVCVSFVSKRDSFFV